MLKVEYTTQFKRDLKLAKKRKKDMAALQQIMKKQFLLKVLEKMYQALMFFHRQ